MFDRVIVHLDSLKKQPRQVWFVRGRPPTRSGHCPDRSIRRRAGGSSDAEDTSNARCPRPSPANDTDRSGRRTDGPTGRGPAGLGLLDGPASPNQHRPVRTVVRTIRPRKSAQWGCAAVKNAHARVCITAGQTVLLGHLGHNRQSVDNRSARTGGQEVGGSNPLSPTRKAQVRGSRRPPN